MRSRIISASYLQNFVFGVEDALVSTVGLLSGVAIAGVDKKIIFITGIVLIFVEAFSMAVGSFLSSISFGRYLNKNEKSEQHSLVGGLIMFASYFLAGFVPLFPYVIWETAMAFNFSIIFSIISLFILGMVSGTITKDRVIISALRMALVGGFAIGVGVLVGKIVS